MKFLIIFLLLLLPLLAEVGKITHIKGNVSIQRDGKSKVAKAGMQLKQKDIISTKKSSLAKILFADKSAVSVGSKSNFSIEEYFFDEKKDSTAKFKIKRGVLRVITGKIAKISPTHFKLKTKTATIGIRGTIFSGRVGEESEEWFCEKGAIYVKSKGVSMNIAKGFKTKITRGNAPTKPQKYKTSDLQKLTSEMTGWKSKQCQTKN